MPHGGPVSLPADSHEHATDPNIGQGQENRGIGNFRPKDTADKAASKVQDMASSAKEAVSNASDKAQSAVTDASSKAQGMASDASSKVQSMAKDASAQAKDVAHEASNKAQDLANEAGNKAQSLADKFTSAEGSLLKRLELQSNIVIPSLKEAMAKLPKEEEYKPEDRPLNEQEQRGVYWLAGLVGGGWLLSSLFTR
jgi:vacuolar-type H+-ATPase subunit H